MGGMGGKAPGPLSSRVRNLYTKCAPLSDEFQQLLEKQFFHDSQRKFGGTKDLDKYQRRSRQSDL